MDLRSTATATCLAVTFCVALAAPALGAPAGDEYLPKVPKASGNSSGHDDAPSGGSTDASSSQVETTETQPEAAAPTGGGGDSGKGDGKPAKSANPAPAPVESAPVSSSDDSSDSTLSSPVVILLIAGVLIAAVGMTLRRRNAGDEVREQDGDASRSERGKTPPTPDGEIVAGGDRPG